MPFGPRSPELRSGKRAIWPAGVELQRYELLKESLPARQSFRHESLHTEGRFLAEQPIDAFAQIGGRPLRLS